MSFASGVSHRLADPFERCLRGGTVVREADGRAAGLRGLVDGGDERGAVFAHRGPAEKCRFASPHVDSCKLRT